MGEHTDEIVVVGAGAVGATIAYELGRAGLSVRLVDSGEGPGGGCSYANAGLLTPNYVEPLATLENVRLGLRYLFAPKSPFRLSPHPSLVPWLASFVASARPGRAALMTERLQAMARYSLALHLAYPEQGVETGVVRTGSLDAWTTPEGWEKARDDLPEDTRMDAEQVAEVFPGLHGVQGGVFHEEDATCNTLQYVTAMVEAAQAHGVTVQWGTRVEQVREEGGRVAEVTLSDGTRCQPRQLVLAAGLGTGALCEQLGLRMPLKPATGYVVDVPHGPSTPPYPVMLKELKVVLTPLADRMRAAGTLDLSAQPGRSKADRLESVREVAQEAMPDFAWDDPIDTWAGDRPCTSDGMPVIGASRHVEGLVVAAGHGMWGMMLAPITAEWVLRGLTGDPSALSDPAMSPDRFTHFRRRPTSRGGDRAA
ncbi:NAD(P)/FAD-dependent oxidoreductase [Kytococcus sp. Marseille-QA3725]